MEITLKFDPQTDSHDEVCDVVNAIYDAGPQVRMFNQSEHTASTMAQAVAGMSPTPLASAVAPGASAPATATRAAANVGATTSPGGVDLDATGIPWDARIHSSGVDEDGKPKKTAKGVWGKRKGVADSEVARVTAELLNMMAANAGANAAIPATGVVGSAQDEPAQTAVEVAPGQYAIAQPGAAEQALTPPAQFTEQALTPPAAAMLAPAVVLAAPTTPTDFPGLMQYLTANLKQPANPAGKLEQSHVAQICTHFGLVDGTGTPSLTLAQQRPDLIKVLHESFENFVKAL